MLTKLQELQILVKVSSSDLKDKCFFFLSVRLNTMKGETFESHNREKKNK